MSAFKKVDGDFNNILFICYYFNPIKAIGSIRNTKLAKYLAKQGYIVRVLSTQNYKLFKRDEFLNGNIKNLNVCYNFTLDYQTLKLIILKFSRQVIEFKPYYKRTHRVVLKMLNLFPINIVFGEGGIFYIIISLLKSIFLIKKYKINKLWTSYSPYSDIFIGYLLKLLFKNLVWIADFRDLYIKSSEKNLLIKPTVLLNKFVLKRASYITTVSVGLAKEFKNYNSNVYVLRNGFDSDDIKFNNKFERIDRFSFFYGGALYGGRRSPELLLKVLSNLVKENMFLKSKLSILYAGKEGNIYYKLCKKYNLESSFTDYGFLDRKKTLLLQRKSYFLVMLTWAEKTEKGILSGKFYEYLSAQRPIICIINGIRDKEIEKIYNRINAGIVIYNNEEKKLNDFLLKHLNRFKTGNFNYDYNMKEVNKYAYQNLAVELSNLFKLCSVNCSKNENRFNR